MCGGSGAISSPFPMVIGCVVTVEVHGCGSNIASAPTLATLGAGALVEARTRITQLEHALQQGACNVRWPTGGYSCSRETRQMGRRREDMAKLELLDESLRGIRIPGAVDGHDRCSCISFYRALDRISNAPHRWSMEAWRMLCQAFFQRAMQGWL